MEPLPQQAGSEDGFPTIQVDQDRPQPNTDWNPLLELADLRQPQPASKHRRMSSPGSSAAEDEWHLVSPNGSHQGGRSSTDSISPSFGVAGYSDQHSDATDPVEAQQNEELANSVLTQPLEGPAGAGPPMALPQLALALMGSSEASEVHEGDSMDAVRSLSGLSQEGSLDGLSDDADDVALASPSAGSRGPHLPALLAAKVTSVARSAGSLVAGKVAALGSWLVESVTALVGAAGSTAERLQAVMASATRKLLDLFPRKGSGAVDWGHLALAATTVVSTAYCVYQAIRIYKLDRQLHTSNKELAKLVMRVVSLQEVLQQSRHLPITRYTSYNNAYNLASTCM